MSDQEHTGGTKNPLRDLNDPRCRVCGYFKLYHACFCKIPDAPPGTIAVCYEQAKLCPITKQPECTDFHDLNCNGFKRIGCLGSKSLDAKNPSSDAKRPNDAEIKKMLADAQAEIKAIEHRCEAILKDRTVTIISKFNGQPYGSSRKPMTGKTFTVKGCWIDGNSTCIRLDGERLSIRPEGVIFEP
jgi:hypothetical protein